MTVFFSGLAGFFKTDSSLGKQRQEVIRQQNELINASKGVKRPRQKVVPEEEADEAQPGPISAAQYSQAAQGRPTTAAVSIFNSSSSGISFSGTAPGPSMSADEQQPLKTSRGQAPPARKKFKIVVKSFPTANFDDPDENNPHNKQTSTMTRADAAPTTTATTAVEEDCQEKAKTYVNLLKKCLTSEEFSMFKQAIKYYKAASDWQTLRPVLEAVLVKYQVEQRNILTGFRVFLKKHHLEEFEAFCLKESL